MATYSLTTHAYTKLRRRMDVAATPPPPPPQYTGGYSTGFSSGFNRRRQI